MKLTKLLATMTFVGMSIAASPSFASITFGFDPTGAGGAGVTGDILDWAPGSTLAIGGAGGGAVLPVGTVLTNLYQANLASVQLGGGNNVYSNGAGGTFFTLVATFTEQVTLAAGNATSGVNNFDILGGSFAVYAQNAAGDNLNGTGFAGAAGTAILSGAITGGNASVAAFFTQTGLLDQANDDDWGGTQTIATTGGSNVFATITGVDAGYFPDLLVGGSFTFSALNASLITPFNQVDPSLAFSSNLVADGDVAANVGALNGFTGPNFIFQTDSNASFTRNAVPEPGSLALAGLALAGVALMARRRKQAVKDDVIA